MNFSRREMLQGILAASSLAVVNRHRGLAALVPKSEWELYNVDGQFLFPLYGSNGGLTTGVACWIVNRDRTKAAGMEFTDLEFMEVGDDPEAIKSLVLYRLENAKRDAVVVNFDGGNLPRAKRSDYVLPREARS